MKWDVFDDREHRVDRLHGTMLSFQTSRSGDVAANVAQWMLVELPPWIFYM